MEPWKDGGGEIIMFMITMGTNLHQKVKLKLATKLLATSNNNDFVILAFLVNSKTIVNRVMVGKVHFNLRITW